MTNIVTKVPVQPEEKTGYVNLIFKDKTLKISVGVKINYDPSNNLESLDSKRF